MTDRNRLPNAYLDLAELIERTDNHSPLLGRIRPVRTSHGLVAVKADLGPTEFPVVQSLIYNEGVLTVDIRCRDLGLETQLPPSDDFLAEVTPTYSCTLDELLPTWEDGVTSPDLVMRRTIVGDAIRDIKETGSAYDALRPHEPRIMPSTGEQYGPDYYLLEMLQRGEKFPPAVMEAVLQLED